MRLTCSRHRWKWPVKHSMTDRKIYKPRPISGFPEWLPEVRRVEQIWLDHIRRVFESYGYCSIETPAVEELNVIQAKGGDGGADVDKEVYVIERLHKEDGDKESRLALHFDQTVPLARYVAQNFNDLTFPFKRYQMQKVWRGERPQAGRFREFYQCDIDVINVDNLPLSFDAEMPAIIWEILSSLPGMENEKIQIRVSNRKILIGFLQSLNIPNKEGSITKLNQETITEIIRDIDKLSKMGKETVLARIDQTGLQAGLGFRLDSLIKPFIDLCSQKFSNADDFREALINNRDVDTSDPVVKQGIEELFEIMESLAHLPIGSVVADLSIVRGLDYYTGTVYETVFLDNPEYGSICSGGRYDDLASNYINKKLPGVGISIGFTRLFAKLLNEGKLPIGPKSAADILMVIPSEERRALAAATARTLRARGYNVELYHAARKIPDQMKYASKKQIPYVWFPPFDDTGSHEVKNMITGEQTKTEPEKWNK
jgi:histidyl-tRNA synthetase